MPTDILIYLLLIAYLVFLICGLTIRGRWRDRIAPQTYGAGSPLREGRTILVVKPAGHVVDQGWTGIASFFVGGIFLLWMIQSESASTIVTTAGLAIVGALIVLPWAGLVLTLGHCFTLTREGITRSAPFRRDRSMKWSRVKSLKYDEMIRGGYVISDGAETFTIDTMVKNGRSFVQFAREGIPAEAWKQSAIDEAEASMRYSKDAGPHMVRTAKNDRL